MPTRYELLIIGGGISGTSLLYAAAKYSGLSRIGLVEKYADLATVNSHGRHNSQTLHCGDIETNYSLSKALHVKQAADMIVNYACQQENTEQLIHRYSKMVLGVGDQECADLRQRFKVFSPHYSNMRLLNPRDIARIEPNVARYNGKSRPEPIVALGSTDDYAAGDFAALSRSFAESAQTVNGKDVQIHLETQVDSIEQKNEIFHVKTNKGTLEAEAVVVSAGGHSLLLAQQMGYGSQFSVFPVAGSFYFTPKVLNGKVYTVQNDKLPFAAIHGDPDMLEGDSTRFGPTAILLPMLERYSYRSIPEFLSVLGMDKNVMSVFLGLLKEPDIRNYIIRNVLFEIPVLRRYLFLQDARKIVPMLRLKDVRYAKGFGGLRPQLVDKVNRELRLGEAKIDPGTGIIFNMTPSPGATSCLQNAQKDLQKVCSYLGASFYRDQFMADLVTQSDSIHPQALLPVNSVDTGADLATAMA